MNSTEYHTDPSTSCVVVQTPIADDGAQSRVAAPLDMSDLRQGLLQAVVGHSQKEDMLAAVAQLISTHFGSAATIYYDRDDSQALSGRHLNGDPPEFDTAVCDQLLGWAELACKVDRLVLDHLIDSPQRCVACVPIQLPSCPSQAILIVFNDVPPDSLLNALEIVAAYITLWYVHRTAVSAEHEAQLTAALQDLLEEAENCDDVRQACQVLSERLQEYFHCERVAIATISRWNNRNRLQAISGIAKFDKHAPLVSAIEATLDEAILRETVTIWPPMSSSDRHAALAHHKLCSIADASRVISSPVRNGQGELVGTWLLLGDSHDFSPSQATRLLQALETRVASCLSLLGRARRGPLSRFLSKFAGPNRTWKASGMVLGLCMVIAALFVPIPHRISCDCQLEPVTRRFLAAPYDGILERSLVTAGATVAQGDVLALMDGREVRWELAGITAERDRAFKQYEAAFANHDFAGANVARLEADRLDLKKQLYESRQEHLEITSPIAGIVIIGDLEKAQGAPVKCGQTLFEVAPLGEMIAELAIPEKEIPYVQEGQKVVLRLEACPRIPLRAKITRIKPRSQIREQQNVFLAEVTLANTNGPLRPGMQGTAHVVGPRRAVGWILLHKPWETLQQWLGW